MDRDETLRYAAVALVVVVLLSVGVAEAVKWSFRRSVEDGLEFDADACESARMSAYQGDGADADADGITADTVAYADLAPPHRDAFETALRRANSTVSIDPDTLTSLPGSNATDIERDHLVDYNGSQYRMTVSTRGCYAGTVGPPGWLRPVLVPFLFVNEVVRRFWTHVAVVVGLVVGYRAFQNWIRFGP